jgi:hypothetical protein
MLISNFLLLKMMKMKNMCTMYYDGPKIPPLPEMPQPHLPEAIETHELVSNSRAAELDFQFMKDMTATPNCPEYNGYNTKVCLEQGHMLKKKTNIVCLRLIDKAPADPTTIMSATLKARAVTEATGQAYVIFTADQQLYRIAAHVMWHNPTLFGNILYLRLVGMHANWQKAPGYCTRSTHVGGRTHQAIIPSTEYDMYGRAAVSIAWCSISQLNSQYVDQLLDKATLHQHEVCQGRERS